MRQGVYSAHEYRARQGEQVFGSAKVSSINLTLLLHPIMAFPEFSGDCLGHSVSSRCPLLEGILTRALCAALFCRFFESPGLDFDYFFQLMDASQWPWFMPGSAVLACALRWLRASGIIYKI